MITWSWVSGRHRLILPVWGLVYIYIADFPEFGFKLRTQLQPPVLNISIEKPNLRNTPKFCGSFQSRSTNVWTSWSSQWQKLRSDFTSSSVSSSLAYNLYLVFQEVSISVHFPSSVLRIFFASSKHVVDQFLDYELMLLDFIPEAGLTWRGNPNELNAGKPNSLKSTCSTKYRRELCLAWASEFPWTNPSKYHNIQ